MVEVLAPSSEVPFFDLSWLVSEIGQGMLKQLPEGTTISTGAWPAEVTCSITFQRTKATPEEARLRYVVPAVEVLSQKAEGVREFKVQKAEGEYVSIQCLGRLALLATVRDGIVTIGFAGWRVGMHDVWR